ncbi:MAG: pseudouridine synthase, partial [Treponema sp.]|nr:pseudouridine synthase [Treponema sp.]
ALARKYLAVCSGKPRLGEGLISMPLEFQGRVKDSQTAYRLVSSRASGDDVFSLLELSLETGRTHQIRRHLALTAIPVLGDDKYGDFRLNRRLHKTEGLSRLLLHASRLIIKKTPDGHSLDLSAPLPDYFRQFTDRHGLY